MSCCFPFDQKNNNLMSKNNNNLFSQKKIYNLMSCLRFFSLEPRPFVEKKLTFLAYFHNY